MRLYIAEKPSLGRAIAAALPGPGQRGQGMIRCGHDQVVSWCIGHLLEPAEPAHYNPQWKRWQLHTLPMLPERWQLQPRPQAAAQLQVLGQLIREADEIVHAGDPDREGQLLVDEVLQWFKASAPVKRVLINDLTPAAVQKALAAPVDNAQFQRLSASARARQRADWLYGLNLTRAYTLLQQQQGQTGVFSVGRVQTPVLGLVASRDRAIANFTPHPYYLLDVTLHKPGSDGTRFMARWLPGENRHQDLPLQLDDEGRLLERAAADTVARKIHDQTGAVVHSRFRERNETPPLPLSLSILQITAARLYGLPAQTVLDAAQSLYEKHQLITYPRSDNRYLPEGQWPDRERVIAAIQDNHPDLRALSKDLNPNQRSRAWNDREVDAHHGIIPTQRHYPLNRLNRSEAAVYDLAARFYLMQFAPDACFREGTLVCELVGERFRARETGLLDPGWKHLEPRQRKREAPVSKPLPRLKEGEPVACLESLVSSRDTQAPSPFTDATLLAAMTGIARFVSDPALRKTLRDTDGLGTEATRAGILQTLFVREFLTREGRGIHATERGLALVDALPASVAAPDRTAHWEAQLETVRHGKDSEDAFIERLQTELKSLLQQAVSGTARQVPDSGVHCPRCRAPMRQRSGQFGDFWSCHRYPQCKGTRPLEDDPQQHDGMDQPPIPCPKCFSPLIRRTSAHGHFWGCSAYPGCRTRFQDRDGKPVIPLP